MARWPDVEEGGESGHGNAGEMRWLLTYADLITLLMVFFVILYAVSQVNQSKYVSLALSLRNSFLAMEDRSGDAVIQTTTQPETTPAILPHTSASLPIVPQQRLTLEKLNQELRQALQKAGMTDQVQLGMTTRGLVISFTEEAAFFAAADAGLQPKFQTLLHSIGPILASVPNAVEVDGYTDDLPLHSAEFKDSWQLSSRRATNVVDYLTVVLGLDPGRFAAVAYGQYRPKYPNDNEADREKNRRVDIVVLPNPPASPWGRAIHAG